MFDNICKFLAETYSTDMASWLLGEPIPLTQVQPQELAVEPIRADSLILLEAEGLLLHLEFQTKADPQIPFRMLDYWVRGKRRFSDKKICQFVIYLRKHLRIDSSKIFKHFADQSYVNKRLRGILIKFIVLAKSAIFAYPSKGSLHDPTL